MTEKEVVELMESSNSEQEWNDNLDKVREACGGYPSFWFPAIVMSGLLGKVAARFGKDDKIHVTPIPPPSKYSEDQEYSLMAVILVSLGQFDNTELAVFNLVMHTQDKVIPQHLCYNKALELTLIDKDGKSPEPELLKRALVHEVMKRKEAGTFN